jgi:hypothetical protein
LEEREREGDRNGDLKLMTELGSIKLAAAMLFLAALIRRIEAVRALIPACARTLACQGTARLHSDEPSTVNQPSIRATVNQHASAHAPRGRMPPSGCNMLLRCCRCCRRVKQAVARASSRLVQACAGRGDSKGMRRGSCRRCAVFPN